MVFSLSTQKNLQVYIKLDKAPYKSSYVNAKKRFTLCLITFIVLGAVIVLYNQVRTLASLEMVTNDPLFVMHYYGGYDFLKRLRVDHRTRQILDIPVLRPDMSSSFAALNPESYAILA